MEETEMLAIKKTEFTQLLQSYPDIKAELKTVAFQRYQRNKEALMVARNVGFKLNRNRYIFYILIYRIKLLNTGLCSSEFYVIGCNIYVE